MNTELQQEMENIRKYQAEVTELKHTVNELKNTVVIFNIRLDESEEMIIQLKGKAVALTQSEQQEEKSERDKANRKK